MFNINKTHQRGLTLVELLISLSITSAILAGVVQVYATSILNTTAHKGNTLIQEHTRFLFSKLDNDIDQTGSGPCFGLNNANELKRITSILGHQINPHQKFDMGNYVSGSEATGVNNSDTLILRYTNQSKRIAVEEYTPGMAEMHLDKSDIDYPSLEQYQVVYVGNCSRMSSLMITNKPDKNGKIEFLINQVSPKGKLNEGQYNKSVELGFGHAFSVKDPNEATANASLPYIYSGESIANYYIGDSGNGKCTDTAPEFCSLFRNDEPLLEGVNQFDVEYGWQDDLGNLSYGDWNAVTNKNVSGIIDRIKINIEFNSIEKVPTQEKFEVLKKNASQVFMIRNQLPVY